ncbi:hypothetical protein H8D04_00545 [bacterium]|nr:hypothetical protein [bacterium]
MICKLCDNDYSGIRGIAMHLSRGHNVSSEHYYEKYILSSSDDVICKNETCNKRVNFINLNDGFNTYCSVLCAGNCKLALKKKRDTVWIRYGVDVITKSNEFKEKSKKTNLKKYGVEYPLQSNEIREKSKQTCLRKYGVDNVSQLEAVQIKKENTMLKNHGTKYWIGHKNTGKNSIRVKGILKSKNITYEQYDNSINDYVKYRRNVLSITRLQELETLKYSHKRGKSGITNSYQLDHKVSIKYGFENAIPPYIIGNIENLEFIPWMDNRKKSISCSMGIDELLNKIWRF